MKNLILAILTLAALAIPASAQCGKFAFNPFTQQMDCIGLGSSSATVSSVGVLGTANQVAVAGASPITTSGTFTLSLPANTIVPGVNGGTLAQAGSGLLSGTYTSGITATGTIGQTCSLTLFNNGNTGGTATVALTGTNAIAGGTALVITAAGSGNTSASTSATVGNGTATCTGPATVATVLTGFAVTITGTGTTNSTLPVGTHSLAPLDSPTFTGTPAAPTPAAADNSTTVPTTAYVTTAVTNAVNAAAGRDLVTAATAAVLPNTPTFTHVDSGIGSFLTSSTNSVLVVDGYTPLLNDRILVKNEATGANNGIYKVTQLGVGAALPWILTRALDYDQVSDMNNTIVPVANNGTANAETSWIMTSTVATVDTDAVTFAAFTPGGANIVTAVSPGVGLCHFAGSTQACTSSLIVDADVTAVGGNKLTGTNNVPTGVLPLGTPVLITKTTVTGSPAANITFSSIAATYTDLMVTCVARGDTAATVIDVDVQFNADTGSNYNYQYLKSTVTTASANNGITQTFIFGGDISAASDLANAPGILTVRIPDYAGGFLKVTLGDNTDLIGAAITNARELFHIGGMWNNTAAITAIKLFPSAGNFVVNSVCSLYGI